jgi:hypothetical protein
MKEYLPRAKKTLPKSVILQVNDMGQHQRTLHHDISNTSCKDNHIFV